jgi:hypothetical protein
MQADGQPWWQGNSAEPRAMATYYHGTTREGLMAILHGQGKPCGPWTCSDRDGMTYLWDPERLMAVGEIEEPEEAIRRAFESAQFQAAAMGDDTTLYVLELDLDSEGVDVDASCENMEHCGAIPSEYITPDRIVRVHAGPFSKWVSPYLLAGRLDSELLNRSAIDEKLLEIAELVARQRIFIDDIYEISWSEVDLATVAREFGLDAAAFGEQPFAGPLIAGARP